MPSTRQNLISNSPFLSGQREKIGGGMKVKRSTITADAFKKGTSQETADNIESRVGNNERKITLLKNIIKLRKENVDNKLEGGGQSVGLKGILDNIASTVDSIRDTLIGQQEFDKDQSEDARIAAAQEARAKQEKDAEKERFAGIKKIGDKVLAPVKSLWSRIWNFISTIFLGKVLLGLLDWFGNKENKGKINSLVGFVKTWWPALVAAVLLFGTGFGGLVATLVGAAIAAVPSLIVAGKALTAAIAANPMAAAIATGAVLGIGGAVMHRMNKNKGDDKEEKEQGVTKEFHEGGIVPGSGNKDTVPAMLTPGEFVMSKGAVQQYGVNTLAGMNAAAGGTNRPKEGRYNTGGEVKKDNTALIDRIQSQYPEMSREEIRILVENEQAQIKQRESQRSQPHPLLGKPELGSSPVAMEVESQGSPIVPPQKEIKLSSNQNTKSADGISKRSKPKGGVTVVQGGGTPSSSADTQAQDSGGGKIPIFEPGMMRDSSKIKTLGILIL